MQAAAAELARWQKAEIDLMHTINGETVDVFYNSIRVQELEIEVIEVSEVTEQRH